jgi:hypothetical protein
MTRRVTLTYDLPEELCHALERQAAAQGRTFEQVLLEHMVRRRPVQGALSDAEKRERRAAFERHFGQWSISESASRNDHIDTDLAREYEGTREQ